MQGKTIEIGRKTKIKNLNRKTLNRDTRREKEKVGE